MKTRRSKAKRASLSKAVGLLEHKLGGLWDREILKVVSIDQPVLTIKTSFDHFDH